MLNDARFLARTTMETLLRRRTDRQTQAVVQEYTAGWELFARHLAQSATLDSWMRIKGMEDVPQFSNVAGRMSFGAFDSYTFNRKLILDAIRREFPQARGVTEFGCGVGRNLLYLKREMPELECFGYELCRPGVEIAQAAAKKFGLDVQYSQLDYVKGAAAEYVFPATDVAFTMYSLEQLPVQNGVAVQNILAHVNLGSIHLEPVPENYPFSVRGLLGRFEHWKANYLADFEHNVSLIPNVRQTHTDVRHSHNPLMFPSLYILKKKTG